MRIGRVLPLLLGLVLLAAPAAQEDPAAAASADDDTIPALVAIGIDAGFPAYQTVTARASLQARFVGVAVRGGWGAGSGPYVGATLRGYPPIPGSPVPVWAGGGLGATAAGATPFVAAGAHVPVAPRWRVDVEAGVAFPELLDDRNVAPHVAVGASYAFGVDLDASPRAAASDDADDEYEGASCEPTPPDPSRLDAALDATVSAFVADARASYGSLYDSLRYSVRVRGRDVDGDVARVRVSYSGSVREIATGERVSASGDARATFRWNGCGWRRTDLSY